MPGDSKRPASDDPEDAPSRFPGQPLGALSRLPDVLLGLLCSYLSGRELSRLGASCASLHWGSHCLMSRMRVKLPLRLIGESESEEEMSRGRSAAFRLARRVAAASVKEVRIEDPRLIEPFVSALRTGKDSVRGALTVTCLWLALVEIVTENHYNEITEGAKQVFADVLADGRLPMLRELHLHVSDNCKPLPRLEPVWRALEQGACPRLQSLRLEAPEPDALVELAAAVVARRGRCEELNELRIDFEYPPEDGGKWGAAGGHEALECLLRHLSPNLETLYLRFVHASTMPTALAALVESGCRALQSLTLIVSTQAGAPAFGDVLLHGLADGAALGLRQLRLERVLCSESDEAWLALSKAMQVEGGCLCRLQSIKLEGVFRTFGQVEIFTRALGSGHGCPELETLSLPGLNGQLSAGAFLAPAFRPPRGLPLLKRLDLHGSRLDDGDLLLDALRGRPHALRMLEELVLSDCSEAGLGGLAGAMQEDGPLAALKQLDMPGSDPSAEMQQWAMGLIAALASGAGRQLETIKWPGMVTVEPINHFLRALVVDGACPQLRCFTPHWISYEFSGAVGLDVQAVGALLAGKAACSATLTEVDLKAFKLGSPELTALTACLGVDQAVQLEMLCLSVGGTCLQGLMDLLDALDGRVGSRLKHLDIKLTGCGEQEGKEVVDRLVAMIEVGGLPADAPSFCAEIDFSSPWTGHSRDRLLRAVRSRAEAL